MAQPGNSLFRRIRNVKSSLDNAEQSFLDNKDIRGELDLMLAEAELKNLRKKKDVPWSWNRQLLAGCIAVLLVLAGVGGWYFARGHYKQRARAAAPPVVDTANVAGATALPEAAKQQESKAVEKVMFSNFSEAELCLLRRFFGQILDNISEIPVNR